MVVMHPTSTAHVDLETAAALWVIGRAPHKNAHQSSRRVKHPAATVARKRIQIRHKLIGAARC